MGLLELLLEEMVFLTNKVYLFIIARLIHADV